MKKGYGEYEFLKSALRKCQENEIPSETENRAIVSFVDKFVTCSLQDPRSSKIAAATSSYVYVSQSWQQLPLSFSALPKSAHHLGQAFEKCI